MRLVFLILFVSLFLSGCFTNGSNNLNNFKPKVLKRVSGECYKADDNYDDCIIEKRKARIEKTKRNRAKQVPEFEAIIIRSASEPYEGEFKPRILIKPSAKQIEAMENYNSPQEIRKREIEREQRKLQYKRYLKSVKESRDKYNPEVKRNREMEENNRKLVKQKRELERQRAEDKQTFENAKVECEAIGYKKGTEKFGECVLDLTE